LIVIEDRAANRHDFHPYFSLAPRAMAHSHVRLKAVSHPMGEDKRVRFAREARAK